MQLADPGLQSVEELMKALRGTIAQVPYDLVKLPHHGARNAVDAELLAETRANLFLISGGIGSSKHPHPETLATLAEAEGIAWYRTDRNGLVSVDLKGQGMPYANPVPGEDPGPAAAAVEKKLLCQFTCLGLGW
jgi:beta-lactamase superfamily II metal-dependent hydrolase